MIMKHVRQSPASVTQAVLAGVTPGGSGQGAGNGKIEAEYGRQQTAEAEAYGRWFMAGDYGRRITAVWQRGWKTAVWRKLGRSYGVGITGGIGGMGGIGIGGIGVILAALAVSASVHGRCLASVASVGGIGGIGIGGIDMYRTCTAWAA